MASHELRSPLTSIKGFIELLARSPDGLTGRQREFVDIISRSTERLVELVNDLLDVAKIEADRIDIDLRPIDVGEAVYETVELMRPRFEAKGQQLGVFVAPTMPLALADPGRVRQIIANLLTNAHLYTEEGGRIHIGVEGDRARVQLVVADSGIGLAREEYERVFERFYRAADSRATTRHGARTVDRQGARRHAERRDRRRQPARPRDDVHRASPGRHSVAPIGRSPESPCAASACSSSTTRRMSPS